MGVAYMDFEVSNGFDDFVFWRTAFRCTMYRNRQKMVLNILGKFIVGHPGLLPIKGWFDGCSGQIWIDKVLAPHFANTLQSNMPTHYNPSYWIDHFSVHHSGAFVTAVNDWVPTLISYLLGTRASSNLLTLESTNS